MSSYREFQLFYEIFNIPENNTDVYIYDKTGWT